MENQNKTTVGRIMERNKRDAIKAMSVFMAFVLYGAVLIYTGVHNFNLISRTVPPDQQLFAITALLCLEGAAVFLPMAIHFWFAPGTQRAVGYVLYATNFTIVIMNTIVDAITNRQATIPDWLSIYATFILPATPVVIGVGIAFIFLLDPSKKVHDAEMAVKAAQTDAMAVSMAAEADSPEVNRRVRVDARSRVHGLIGVTEDDINNAPKQLPAPASTEEPMRAKGRRRLRVSMARDGGTVPGWKEAPKRNGGSDEGQGGPKA